MNSRNQPQGRRGSVRECHIAANIERMAPRSAEEGDLVSRLQLFDHQVGFPGVEMRGDWVAFDGEAAIKHTVN
jgi:hypothetical protein